MSHGTAPYEVSRIRGPKLEATSALHFAANEAFSKTFRSSRQHHFRAKEIIIAYLKTRLYVAFIGCTTLIIVGCSGSSSPVAVPPPGGFNTSKVTYVDNSTSKENLEPPTDRELLKHIEVPAFAVADRGTNPANVSVNVTPGEEFILEGVVEVPPPVMCGVMVIVEIIEFVKIPDQRGDQRLRSIVANFSANAVDGDVAQGKLNFELLVKAPKKKGKYELDIKFLHPQTSSESFIAATGDALVN